MTALPTVEAARAALLEAQAESKTAHDDLIAALRMVDMARRADNAASERQRMARLEYVRAVMGQRAIDAGREP